MQHKKQPFSLLFPGDGRTLGAGGTRLPPEML